MRARQMAGATAAWLLVASVWAGADMLEFLPEAEFRRVDADGDGRFEALEVDVPVEVKREGAYVVFGHLTKAGQLVAHRPAYESASPTQADVPAGTGRITVTLRYSGEQVRRSGLDGPYELRLMANGETSAAGGPRTYASPPFRHAQFGEPRAGR